MQKLTVGDIVKAAGGTLKRGQENIEIKDVKTNSREIKGGELFIAIKGENNDGHKYLDGAVENGAAAVLVSEDYGTDKAAVIQVRDTIKAYGDIARYYKAKYNIPTIAITGSVGKTTTKDMIYSAVAAGMRAMKTEDNYNNHIGVPLTVLRIEKEHEAAVIEMGMNHFGEIDYLASIVKPDVAVITNIGMSHIANLGSQEGIFKAKTEIANYFDGHNTLIVNGDDKFLGTLKQGTLNCKVVYYGVKNPENDIKAYDVVGKGLYGVDFKTEIDGKEYAVSVDIPGVHNAYNALAAIAAARALGVPAEKAVYGVEHVELTKGRLEIVKVNGASVIKDFYNASPDSVKSALQILSCADEKRKIAVLGDILEMGKYAPDAHYKLGNEVVKNGADMLITAGENARCIAQGARDAGMEEIYSFDTTDGAAAFAKGEVKSGDAVLIKASHGMEFERIFKALSDK